jgi:hypothetical protein
MCCATGAHQPYYWAGRPRSGRGQGSGPVFGLGLVEINLTFRPISLCNVAYKIISKTLAERLKPCLPHNIDASQSAFGKGRHISTNIIISQEIIHSFSLGSWTDTAFLLKIDLAKAFDRLRWDFIVRALQRLHLSPTFINLVYRCISTASFSILLNGEPTVDFKATRGIRQGCPLSPYLFVVAIYELPFSSEPAS